MSVPGTWEPEARELFNFLAADVAARHFCRLACDQNKTLANSKEAPVPRIRDAEQFASCCNYLLTQSPKFYDGHLLGLPFSALISGLDATISGSRLLDLPGFNEQMGALLAKWFQYLESFESADGFSEEGVQWLTNEAKIRYRFDLWIMDNETAPYWNSWNSFFARQFKNPTVERPIAGPLSNQIAICPNDGTLFRWDWDVAEDDLFWFKDMNYSLRHILSSPDPQQQRVINEYKLVEMFRGGYIFQTFLNPYDYHRWWVPVHGRVLFDPILIPGTFFGKLMTPDFEGAGVGSLPYLCQVNARGIVVFKTEDYGNVCCIPLGLNEVSSIEFNADIVGGAEVAKGQEMGMFKYGGSSFAILFQKLDDKELVFHNGEYHFPQRPELPTGASAKGGTCVKVGSQIGAWYSL